MTDFANKVKKGLRDGLKAVRKGAAMVAEKTPGVAAAVAEKTQEAVSRGKLSLQIQSRERDMDRAFRDLGKGVYALLKKKTEKIAGDAGVLKSVKTVDALKKQIRALEKKIKELKS